jgi:hypothetical protein
MLPLEQKKAGEGFQHAARHDRIPGEEETLLVHPASGSTADRYEE